MLTARWMMVSVTDLILVLPKTQNTTVRVYCDRSLNRISETGKKYDFSFHPACETGWLSLKGSPECFISRIMLFIAFSVTCQNRWRSKKSVPSYLLFVGFWNCRERFVTNWWIVAEHKCMPTFTIKITYACDIFCSTMVVNHQTVRIWNCWEGIRNETLQNINFSQHLDIFSNLLQNRQQF